MEWLNTWLKLSTSDRILNILLLIAFATFLGYGLVKLLKALKRQGIAPAFEKTKGGFKVEVAPEAPLFSPSLGPGEKSNAALYNPPAPKKVPFNQHTVFFTLKKFMERGVEFETAGMNPNKAKITAVFLEECMSKTFYERLRDWVCKLEEMGEDDRPSASQYCIEEIYTISDKIYQWIDEYNQRARGLRIDLPDGRSISGVPEVFLRKFDSWHEVHVETILYKIRQILYSEFYLTWQLKLILILDHLDTVFMLTEYDARKTIADLNGDLDREIEAKIKKGA